MDYLIVSGFVVFTASLFAVVITMNPPFIVLAGLQLGFGLVASAASPEDHEPQPVIIEVDSIEVNIQTDF